MDQPLFQQGEYWQEYPEKLSCQQRQGQRLTPVLLQINSTCVRRRTEKVQLYEIFQTRQDAKKTIFDYIEVFYNQKRKQYFLHYFSPVDYENSV